MLDISDSEGLTPSNIPKTTENSQLSIPGTTTIKKAINITIDQPLELVDIPDMNIKIARLPLGPTRSHINAVVQPENIFVGEKEWKNATISVEVPQAFGYTIENDAELARVITDEETLKVARRQVEISGIFPTIYLLSRKARLVYAAYLGGRIPEQEEQKNIWDKLPGENVLEKATSASIPFSGYFDNIIHEFRNVGDWTFLLSSSKNDVGIFGSLNLSSGNRDVDLSWHDSGYGLSSFVVFDKKPLPVTE